MSTVESSLRDLFTSCDEPILLEKRVSHWEIVKSWTINVWCEKIGPTTRLPFRSGKIAHSELPQWESTCTQTEMTMNQFLGHAQTADPSEWLYFDYKHLHEWFKDKEDFLKDISWKDLGFPDRKADDSTLWIGSQGAHTPCHVDTYGFNLVAQIHGKKQWILFPPGNESRKMLRATRVPYEESSIYSEINFFSPPKRITLTGARVVTLNPGDVLFVPNGWWHYVETISPLAVSLNTWIPLPCDRFRQVEESLVKLLVSSVCRFDNKELILNPNEADITEDKNILNYVKWATHICTASDFDEPPAKKCRSETSACGDLPAGASRIAICSEDDFKELMSLKRKVVVDSVAAESDIKLDFSKKLINAMCAPDVLSKIRDHLLKD
ncbi:HSPB1-associated protein 1 isoform X2 [Cloeon dipterum]|uniref:HSPB1-associated protein 1 isoform X2 n=1 Tax=Cloeon dipterum TaxID=197152 RepID=UPI00321FC980